jgi:hypothetical protein
MSTKDSKAKKNWLLIKTADKVRKAKSLGAEQIYILITVLVLGLGYMATFMAYLWLVHVNFIFTKYYPQFPVDHPGQSTDLRLSPVRLMFIFPMIRLPFGLSYIWLMRKIGSSIKINFFIIIFILAFIIEVVTLVVTFLFFWPISNNSAYLPENPFNDPNNFCKAYASNFPDYCPYGSGTDFPGVDLLNNINFIRYFYFNIAFLILTIIMGVQIPVMLEFKSNSYVL